MATSHKSIAAMFTPDNSVTVDLGDRSYPIAFMPLSSLGQAMAACRKPSQCYLVSNDKVGPIYAEKAMDSLKSAGWKPKYIEIPDGEENKTPETYVNLVERLLELDITRSSPVIGLGGGVTTDIVGFAAATVQRGVPFVNVPTSLLAMVDASVGGKTGVNTKRGKNLLGAFWQPFLVHVAVETLETLDNSELNCGLGEVVKHAVLDEVEVSPNVWKPSKDFFEWLEAHAEKVKNREPAYLIHAIRRSCEIKAAIVKQDERETDKRALLNLGHTIGHAIEQVVGFGSIRHGEAVGIGTMAETQLSVLKNHCQAPELPHRIGRLLKRLDLPTGYPGLDADLLEKAVFADKKRDDQVIAVTLPVDIGKVDLIKLTPAEIRQAFVFLDKNAVL